MKYQINLLYMKNLSILLYIGKYDMYGYVYLLYSQVQGGGVIYVFVYECKGKMLI